MFGSLLVGDVTPASNPGGHQTRFARLLLLLLLLLLWIGWAFGLRSPECGGGGQLLSEVVPLRVLREFVRPHKVNDTTQSHHQQLAL